MENKILRYRYGKSVNPATAITKAVRDDIDIGGTISGLLKLLHERLHGKVSPGERVIANIVYNDIDAAYAMMRDATARRYGFGGQVIEWSSEPHIAIVSGNTPPWMMPIYQAWRKLAELDFRELDSATLDFACEIKRRLQSTF